MWLRDVSWSATVSASAMLVSTSRSGPLPLPGIAKRPDEVLVDLPAGGRDHQPSLALVKRFPGHWFNPQARAFGRYLDLAGAQAKVIAQAFWDHQSACLVDGCAQACNIPSATMVARRSRASKSACWRSERAWMSTVSSARPRCPRRHRKDQDDPEPEVAGRGQESGRGQR
jgi:hypothetical protein